MRSVMVAVVVVLATALHASVWLLMHEQAQRVGLAFVEDRGSRYASYVVIEVGK